MVRRSFFGWIVLGVLAVGLFGGSWYYVSRRSKSLQGRDTPSFCSHPYYPLQKGYHASYEMRAHDLRGSPRALQYTQTVDVETATSVHLLTSFTKERNGAATATAEQWISCDVDGLRTNIFVDFSSRLTGDEMGPVQIRTDHVTGLLLPTLLTPSSTWDGSFQVTFLSSTSSVPVTSPPVPLLAVHLSRRVVGEEEVTVPAGTYRALKVVVTTQIDQHPGSIEATEWWAKDHGLIKSIYPVGGKVGEIVTEAQRIQ